MVMKSIEDIKLEKDAITGDAEAQYKLGVFYYICAYLMVAIVRKRLKIQKSLNEILQIVSVSIFEQMPLEQLLAPQPLCSDQTNADELSQNLLPLNC
jgi:hypothetical protein